MPYRYVWLFLMNKVLSSCLPLSKEVSVDIVCISIIFIIQLSGKPPGQIKRALKEAFGHKEKRVRTDTHSLYFFICRDLCPDNLRRQSSWSWLSLEWFRGTVGRSPSGCCIHLCTVARMNQGVPAGFDVQPSGGWGFPAVEEIGGWFQVQRLLSHPSHPSGFLYMLSLWLVLLVWLESSQGFTCHYLWQDYSE